MRRVGAVLFALALAVQFSAGAGLFQSHERWTQTCESHSKHVCSDINPHDPDHCSICLVCATGPTLVEIDSPAFFHAEAPLVALTRSNPAVIRECDCSCPRGPPAPTA